MVSASGGYSPMRSRFIASLIQSRVGFYSFLQVPMTAQQLGSVASAPGGRCLKAHARRASAMMDASALKSFRIARTARDILSQLALNDRETGHELL